MSRSIIRRIFAAVILAVMIITVLPIPGRASASVTPGKPKITVKSVANGSAVVITIKKTKNTDGYGIYMKGPGDKDYQQIDYYDKSGNKKRTYVVRISQEGKYSFKVQGEFDDGHEWHEGKFSKVKSVTIKYDKKDLADVTTGDIVALGAYEQDNNKENGKETVEWIVLSNDGSKLFLLAKNVLDAGKINPQTDEKITYENSYLRKWLNDYFLNNAFNEAQAGIIAETELEDVGTTDKVFLLSQAEATSAEYGLGDKMDRRCGASVYAQSEGDRDGDGKKEYVTTCQGYLDNNFHYAYSGQYACYWWLRTATRSISDKPEYAGDFQFISERGGYNHTTYYGSKYFSQHYDADGDEKFYVKGFGVRPAIVVELGDKAKELVGVTGKCIADEKAVFEGKY